MTERLVDQASPALKPREKLFEFLRGNDRILCELVDHGPVDGVEAQIFYSTEIVIVRTFKPRLDPSPSPREMAVIWAETERQAIENG
jgi:hypothetical protein